MKRRLKGWRNLEKALRVIDGENEELRKRKEL